MYTVIGYHDLRPVDWHSGKRVPLAPGEGHTCDRCGTEHAIVFEVRDDETGKIFSVGSGCARQQFGFDPEKAEEVRAEVRKLKQEQALLVNQARWQEVERVASQIVEEVEHLSVPEVASSPSKWPSVKAVWTCGDAHANQSSCSSQSETVLLAQLLWLENRVRERVPARYSTIPLGPHPNKLRGSNMAKECELATMKELRSKI